MKTFTATVASTKMLKSAVVTVKHTWTHPKYKKTINKTKKYLVDNPINAAVGSTVEITESRPLSKHKSFVITKIIEA